MVKFVNLSTEPTNNQDYCNEVDIKLVFLNGQYGRHMASWKTNPLNEMNQLSTTKWDGNYFITLSNNSDIILIAAIILTVG
jgi:hypothetical protein